MFDFTANKSDEYLALLRIASTSEALTYSSLQLSNIVKTLNTLKAYQASHKRIMPLLRLKAENLNVFHRLNTDIQTLLNTETQKGVVTELAQKCQLTQIIQALSMENIPMILLKGMAFAQWLYLPNAPRTSNDIDILVKQADWGKAKQVMNTIMAPLPIKHKQVFDDLYETSFIPKANIGAAVDLHKSLVHPYLFKVNEKTLWDESIAHPKYNSALVRVLSAEHAIIHQAVHAFKDMDFSKYNLVDTHEIIKQCQPNLSKAFETAKAWGCAIPLFILLNNCHQIMATFAVEINQKSEQLIQKATPNNVTLYCCAFVLNSQANKLVNGVKTFKYRVIQLMSQFVFTGSFIRPVILQWVYIKITLKLNVGHYCLWFNKKD